MASDLSGAMSHGECQDESTMADTLFCQHEAETPQMEPVLVLGPKVIISPLRWELEDRIRLDTFSFLLFGHDSALSGHPGDHRTTEPFGGLLWVKTLRTMSRCMWCVSS